MEIPENYPKKYWHCHIEVDTGGKKNTSAIFNDLTIKELWQQVVSPWHTHRPFTVDGTIVRDYDKVQKIKITQTEHPQSYYAEQHNASMQRKGIADMATNRRLLPLSKGKDYTHEFLFADLTMNDNEQEKVVSNNKIFIVHGHDEQVKETTARFVEKLGLEAVILHEQANEGKTIIEKLEKHTDVGFSLVLLTPDDVGATVTDKENLKPRARQNVLLELGYMAGKLGRGKVCALKKGDVEIPSDLIGVLYVEIDAAGAWRLQVAKELKVAGLGVDLNNAI
ncbi:MAG TPA: DNA-binding protein [Gammaproteobacteria bacterium]|nr:DNA-binding protein [Gammaproteobacteria bacterium]